VVNLAPCSCAGAVEYGKYTPAPCSSQNTTLPHAASTGRIKVVFCRVDKSNFCDMFYTLIEIFVCKFLLEFHKNWDMNKQFNQNHQLSWWYALCLEGIFTGSPIRAPNGIFIRIKLTGYC